MPNGFDNNETDGLNRDVNSYADNYRQEQMSALEENAPRLESPVGRSINKKAILFVASACLLIVGLTAFAVQQLSDGDEEQQAEPAQVLTVPELPGDVLPDTAAVGQTQPVPLEASQPVVEQSPPPAVISNEAPVVMDSPVVPNTSVQPVQMPREMPTGRFDLQKENTPFVEKVDDAPAAKSGTAVRVLPNRNKLLAQGTYLRCVLETKIVSDTPGFTSCLITETVYSANGQLALIPKGSKVMGQYGSSSPTGPRLGVVWDRIITPDGLDITLRSPGVDHLGAAGHSGDFRTHWPSRLASALLISMMSDAFKYAAAERGKASSVVTDGGATYTNPYESETAETLKQQAINQLERNSSRPNTVTINQGTLINIYTAQDIDFNSVVR